MWAKAIAECHYLVSLSIFHEGHITERIDSEKADRLTRRQHLIHPPGVRSFPLAAIRESDQLRTVATMPNANAAPIQDRTPLVLGFEESSVWLDKNWSRTSNRGHALVSARFRMITARSCLR